ncbi:MAG: haloacid dehalogenase [Chloroflexia bacterium]|nr:haloacid dehalogenase [Chloroflexia bacterium]
MTSDPAPSLHTITGEIVQRFEAMGAARDQAVSQGRQAIRLAANAVRAMHRDAFDEAEAMLDEANDVLSQIVDATLPYPNVFWAGYVQDAMKEFAEASITLALLRGDPLPDPDRLAVEDAAYLNGLAEAASELRRDTLDALRGNRIQRAESLMQSMDAIYSVLVTVDFPDAMTGGLRRNTDQLRAVLERTRGDVTIAVRQNRLEQALKAAEQRMAIG